MRRGRRPARRSRDPKRRTLTATALLLASTSAALAGDGPTLEIVPVADSILSAISPSGEWASGNTFSGTPFRYHLPTGTAEFLGGMARSALDVNDLGQVAGSFDLNPAILSDVAVRWDTPLTWVELGGLFEEPQCDADYSSGYALSADGSVVVGLAWEGCSGRAFRWTADGGMIALPQSGPNSSRANTVSGDGFVVGGWDEGSDGARRPAIWDAGGVETVLGPGPGEVYDTNGDGSVTCGSMWDTEDNRQEPFVLVGGEVQLLGLLPDADPIFDRAQAFACSEDGGVVVGSHGDPFFTFLRAVIWTPEDGLRDLRELLVDAGVEIGDFVALEYALGVSADGRTIVGRGTDYATFSVFSWVVTLPAPAGCDGDLDADGEIGTTDLLDLLAAWGPCTDCDADLDGDGQVGTTDLLELLAAWGPCR